MDERHGAVLGVELGRGALLHNERAMAIFFEGGCNNHPFECQRRRFDLPFSIFCLNIFERAVAFFLWCGGVQNEHDGDHYLETHSLSTSNSNITIHTECESAASSAYCAGPGTMVPP